MNKQNIFIINFNSLYEILNEIKEILSFEITKYEKEADFLKAHEGNTKNFLIISKSKQKIISTTNLIENHFLNLKDLPLSINKLIELINIQLIKLRFNHQSKIIINSYELNINSKFFFKDNVSLKLTEKEIEIILYLFQNKTKHNVLDLQKNIWGYVLGMETHTVETHIYRLRKKIKDKFNDDNFLLSHPDGYFIQ